MISNAHVCFFSVKVWESNAADAGKPVVQRLCKLLQTPSWLKPLLDHQRFLHLQWVDVDDDDNEAGWNKVEFF